MAPDGEVAPALEVCRAAATGAGLEVIRPLALDAARRLVSADVALWADVDVARGVVGAATARPSPVADEVLTRFSAHVAGHPPGGADGRAPAVHGAVAHPDGAEVCLVLPAPSGHRAGIALRRSRPFTAGECDHLRDALPLVACAVLAAWAAPAPPTAATELLTVRETAVLRSVATGMSDKQAARLLGVSPRTVGKHLEHIYAKLGVAGRTEAAAQVWLG